MRYIQLFVLTLVSGVFFTFISCGTTHPTPKPKPRTTVPGTKPNNNTKPANPGEITPNNPSGTTIPVTPTPGNKKQDTYKLAVLLPFLTNQYNGYGETVPEKSESGLQYYGGMQIALKEISKKASYPNLVVDVLDTQASDIDFAKQLNNPRLMQAQVVLGPVRSSHVSALAAQTKLKNQILVSFDSPLSDLTIANKGFIQTNPALRAHCWRVIQFLRSEKRFTADQIVLVAKESESSRLSYFQDANSALGGVKLVEVIVPDKSTNFDKIDLKKQMRAGKTTAFILPTWAGQDWVLSFLSRLRAVKGSNKVEVYGMPQWIDYEQIEPELLQSLNVHISSAAYIDRASTAVRNFDLSFYDQFGTLPTSDAYRGFDVMMWTAEMLQKYGLSFPEKSVSNPAFYQGLSGGYYLRRVQQAGTPVDTGMPAAYEYIENIFVQILKFNNYQYLPAEVD